MDKSNSLNYKVFLESIGYDTERIEKYFHKVISNLESEASFLIGKRDEDVEKQYLEYTKNLELYSQIKYDILSKYFIDYIELNEEYNLKKAKHESEIREKIDNLLDQIERERLVIDQLRSDYLVKFYEAKKEPQRNIDLISKKIDTEYNKHVQFIFDAKKSIENNKEYYITAEQYIEKIDKALEFLDEISGYNEELLDENKSDSKIEANKLSIYLDYINNEIDKTSNTSFVSLYDNVSKTFVSLIDNVKLRKEEILKESKSLKSNIAYCFNRIDKEIEETREYYDKKLINDYPPQVIKEIKKDRDIMLKSLETRKIRISLDYSIEINLLDEEASILDSYINELDKSNKALGGSFIDEMEKSSIMVLSLMKSVREFVQDELRAIDSFERDSNEAREIVKYFNNRFRNLQIESTLEILKNNRESISKAIENNRTLDILAFEILTSEELLKIKLLNLKKTLLTLDDELKIKSIEYDIKIEELEHTSTPLIVINNCKSKIELLKNDLKVDIDILNHDLEHKIKIIDLKKDIDILRNDYMIAYTRLDNISKIIDKKVDIEPKIIDLLSSIELERIVENVLIDSANKMNEYSLTMVKYDKDIEELDSDTNSRIRYLNNVLEIEIKNFENEKSKILKESENRKKEIYPSLVNIKSDSGKKLKELRKKYNADKQYFFDTNNKNKKVYLTLSSTLNDLISEYEKKLENIDLSNRVFINNVIDESNLLVKKVNDELIKNNGYDINEIVININLLPVLSASENKYLKTLKKAISSFIKDLKVLINKELSKIVYYEGKALDKEVKKIDDEYKENIALIAIKNTILETPSLDNLDKIDEESIIKTKEYEKNISSYKKYYMSTIESIRNDYDSRFKELTDLKDKCENYVLNLNESINDKIDYEYSRIKENHEKKIYDATIGERELAKKASASISNMSDEVEKKNSDFEKIKKGYDDINKLYFDTTIEKAKEYYETIKSEMNKFEDDVETYIEFKKQDKSNYMSSLNSLVNEYKSNFNDLNEYYRDIANNKKAEKIFEYTKLLEETKEKNMSEFEKEFTTSKTYEKSLEMLTSSLMEKAKRVNDSLSKDSVETVITFGNKIDKLTNNE